ncbi:MAG: hypothetical protein ABJN34_07390 [Litoreibacter sp.]|uniref:hypothetical protein n=1 Tax=Litoreibacter sp. TaxID=1969459 RepID=UPI003297F2F9
MPILTFLFLPLIVVHEHRAIVKGPWWPALLAILGLPAIMMIVTLVSGTIVARLVGDLAASMGGHYHTWLNATDPGVICAIAIASTVLVSLRWSKELNKAQVPLQAGK